MIGRLLGNRFEILEQLGGGGMAIVYKGRDTMLNRLVTIKVLRPEYTTDDNFVMRFRREARAVARLSHPNIVNIHDVGQENDVHYLVMEYIDGNDLKSMIKEQGPLAVERAVEIARQICQALGHAHENDIVHRDVKPHNVIITKDGRAKLTDFGIASETTTATFTQTDTIVGSVHYISPEQARGEPAGPQSDIYSLGMVLYEMLAGKVAFSGDTPIAVALKHIQEEPEPLHQVNPSVPGNLADVVMRAMAKQPDLRFAGTAEMCRALQQFSAGASEATQFIPLDDMATQVLPVVTPASEQEREEVKLVPRHSSKTLYYMLAALVVLGLLVGGSLATGRWLITPDITVPSVVGTDAVEAKQQLEDLGLKVELQDVYSDVDEGLVVWQSIGPDDPPVKPRRDITLQVSKGLELVRVPNLQGMNLVQARISADEYSFLLRDSEDYHDLTVEGLIFAQEPAPFSLAPKGSEIKVTVSKGPLPAMQRVPDLTGKTLERARMALAEEELVLDEDQISWDENNIEYVRGQVVRQDPAPGETLAKGGAVKVTLSDGPGPAARSARVTVNLPENGDSHEVKIVVNDIQGSRTAYVDSHPGGERVVKTVHYLGRAVIEVYVDNELVREIKAN